MWGKVKGRFKDLFTRDPLRATAESDPAIGEFIKGINLGGKAVTIAGQSWLSDEAARAEGLTTPEANFGTTNVEPVPYLRRDARQMFNSVIYRRHQLEIEQKLPNGDYGVYLWMMENYQSDWHRLTVSLAGQIVEDNVGQLTLGHWRKYGAYRSTVTDGTLRITVTAQNPDVDAHLMGLSFFRL